jgi:hypothetical protein
VNAIVRLLTVDGIATGSDDEIRELTAQFYVTLGAYFSRASSARDTAAAARIRELLGQADRSWTHAYEIEQLLVELFDDATVRTELDVRALEAKGVLRPDQTALYEQQMKSARELDGQTTVERQRVLLARLVNDLQWRYTVNEARRRYTKAITSRAGLLFVTALAAFSVLVAYTVLARPVFTPDDLRLFGFAALAGAWGATFSILTSLRDRLAGSDLDSLKLMRPWVMLSSRALIGAGAACIFFFFILSGLLRGSAIANIFPDFTAGGPAATLPVDQLALLVVWCFLSGFSERLVPGLLQRIESRAAVGGDRFRPTTDGEPAAAQSLRREPVPPTTSAPARAPNPPDAGPAPPPPATG